MVVRGDEVGFLGRRDLEVGFELRRREEGDEVGFGAQTGDEAASGA